MNLNLNLSKAYNALLKEDLTAATVVEVEQSLSALDYRKQFDKYLLRNCLGGAIGIINNPNGQIILVRRSQVHEGWALPGGMVEDGETFSEAFEREIMEEVGIKVLSIQLVMLETKTFVSPSQEKFQFLLAVYTGRMQEEHLPALTEGAIEEGLEVVLFSPDQIPPNMILGDKDKLLAFMGVGEPKLV